MISITLHYSKIMIILFSCILVINKLVLKITCFSFSMCCCLSLVSREHSASRTWRPGFARTSGQARTRTQSQDQKEVKKSRPFLIKFSSKLKNNIKFQFCQKLNLSSARKRSMIAPCTIKQTSNDITAGDGR